MRRTSLVFTLGFLGLIAACDRPAQQATGPAPSFSNTTGTDQGDTALIRQLIEFNQQLAARGMHIAVEAIEYFTIGPGRPSIRLHQAPFRWVPNDPRREAQGTDITYIVDPSWGAATASGVPQAATEVAIDHALATWSADRALKKVNIVKRPYPGGDVTIFDAFFCGGTFGNAIAADIVDAGWYPSSCFPPFALAFSITFLWTDDDGNLTDINGDQYFDTAANEVYYRNFFNPLRPWGINVVPPGFDIETVALHESGHSLGLGHFGPPPDAVMNPNYAGIRQSPLPPDDAGMNAVWSSWPNP